MLKKIKKNKIKLIFCTSKNSWVAKYLKNFLKELTKRYQVRLIFSYKYIKKDTDITFYIGYDKIVNDKYLSLSKINLVVHESDLPKGKGWSPITWGILDGKTEFIATLFKAIKNTDSGNYFFKKKFIINKDCLLDDIRKEQFAVTKYLIKKFLDNYPKILKKEKKQIGKSTYLKRRTPKDSEINIHKSIYSQFDHLRTLDGQRYPGWFFFNGKKFKISISEL